VWGKSWFYANAIKAVSVEEFRALVQEKLGDDIFDRLYKAPGKEPTPDPRAYPKHVEYLEAHKPNKKAVDKSVTVEQPKELTEEEKKAEEEKKKAEEEKKRRREAIDDAAASIILMVWGLIMLYITIKYGGSSGGSSPS
jgi:hypothetical protein